METAFFVILAVIGFGLAIVLRRQSQASRTVHAWEQGLLYVDGRFVEALPPGRYWTIGLREKLVVTLPRFPVPAGFHHKKKAGRREYLRVRIEPGPVAQRFEREGAGLLTSLTQSHAFCELPEEMTQLEPGTLVQVLPFAAIF